jgi:hypothetical protein
MYHYMVLEKEILDVVIQDLVMVSSGAVVLHVHSILFFINSSMLNGKVGAVQIYLPSRSFF